MANKDEIRYTISVDTDSGTASVRNLKGQIVATQVPVKQLRAEFGNFAKTVNATNFNKFNSELKKTGSAVAQMKTASGGATSSVLELGRVIQDAPYGLRGMANNITQLASQMAFATKSAGGFGKALKEMGKAMAGPLGVVFLISLVVSAMEMLQGSIGKTEKDLDKLTDASITNAVSELTTLKNIIEDTSISLERKQEAIRLANEEYSELNISIDGTAESAIQALTALDLLIDKFSDVAYANAITELQVEAMKELANANRNAEGSFGDLFSSFQAFASGMQSLRTGGNAFDMAKAVNIAGIEEDLKEIEDLFKQPTKANPNLTYAELIFGKKDTKGSGGRSRADRVFKEQVLNLEKFISQTNRNAELETEMSAERRLRIEFEYSKADLLIQKTTFVEKQKLRFKQYTEAEAKRQKMSVEDFKKTQQYADEKAKLQQSIDDAEISHQEAHNALILLNEQKMFSARLDALTDFNNRIDKLNLQRAKNIQKLNKSSLGGVSAGSVGKPMSTVGAESVDTQVSDAEDYNELLRSQFEDDIVQKEIELRAKFDSEMQVQAELSKMRYNFNLEEMNREIELEQMKIDAKKNINQEYISWVSGLGSVMRNLAGDNEEIAKLALLIEKGAEIADIVIKTQSANAQVSAIASVRATAGDVSAIPEAKTRILKNNIGSGIAIANILATTLKSQKKPSGSGNAGAGASGGGGRTFDFNLVGSTGENQLAQGIASQLGNPVQAYVVSSQMTSQQQLDNAIQTSATIGD